MHFRWKEVLWCPKWGVHVWPNDKQYLMLMNVIQRLEAIRIQFDKPIIITSGLRPRNYNDWSKPYGVNGAKFSAHKLGEAVDFVIEGFEGPSGCDDVRHVLKSRLEGLKMRMEDKPGSDWVHIDIRQGKNRFFKP